MPEELLTIRTATPVDAAAVAELLEQLGYRQAGSATADRIERWAEDADAVVLVADVGDAVLGVVAVQSCPFFERDGSWGRITALVVSEQARGRGVGARLVAAAEEFATSRGYVRMEVTSADRRRDAHGFYRSRGYVDQAGTSSRFLRDLAQTSAAATSSR